MPIEEAEWDKWTKIHTTFELEEYAFFTIVSCLHVKCVDWAESMIFVVVVVQVDHARGL